jgi:hypothetical protein
VQDGGINDCKRSMSQPNAPCFVKRKTYSPK